MGWFGRKACSSGEAARKAVNKGVYNKDRVYKTLPKLHRTKTMAVPELQHIDRSRRSD